MADKTPQRLEPTDRTKIAVWAAAAGRCTLCKRYLVENEDLGEIIGIGELAHIVGWGDESPRGAAELDPEARRQPENLLLVCRNCHKPIDQGGVMDRYTVDELARFKREHESTMRYLTGIDPHRKATIIRIVGRVRDVNPELTYETVLDATAAAHLFPALLPNAHSAEIDLELRQVANPGTPAYFSRCAEDIDELVRKIDDGIRREEIKRLAVFAFTRIPLLIHLGARLDDKVETAIFQRHRTDAGNAWRWPDNPPPPPEFAFQLLQNGSERHLVALILNMSGTVRPEELPAEIDETYSIYAFGPVSPDAPHASLISSPDALAGFERAIRGFLAHVEAEHGKIDRTALFPAIPLSAGITLGRVLMPNVSPAWAVYDRDEHGQFFEALEVRR